MSAILYQRKVVISSIGTANWKKIFCLVYTIIWGLKISFVLIIIFCTYCEKERYKAY